MNVTKIGGTGLVSSPIGLGCLAFTGGDQTETINTIRQALDLGISMLDMADFYQAGEVERLVGRAVRKRRDETVIATRGGLRFDSAGRPAGIDASPDHLSRACEASLTRLGTDHIDLYYLAGVDPDVPVEESLGRLAELAAAGKIRHVGLVTSSPAQLRRGHRVHPVTAVCAEYSLLERRVEAGCLPVARELGVTLVACRPLGRGALTGQLPLPRGPVEEAARIAAQLDLGLARLALAWLMSQPDVVPIPGTRNPLHLEMNATAVGLRLSAGQCRQLAALFPPTAFDGRD